jgi:hypothetical protein
VLGSATAYELPVHVKQWQHLSTPPHPHSTAGMQCTWSPMPPSPPSPRECMPGTLSATLSAILPMNCRDHVTADQLRIGLRCSVRAAPSDGLDTGASAEIMLVTFLYDQAST